jgi:hypothetical protein
MAMDKVDCVKRLKCPGNFSVGTESRTLGLCLLIRILGRYSLCFRVVRRQFEAVESMSRCATAPPGQAPHTATEPDIPIFSAIDEIGHIPDIQRARHLVCLRGDFLSHARASAFLGLPARTADGAGGVDARPHEALANVVRNLDYPIVCVTAGLTNPLQQTVDLRLVVEHVKRANSEAIVLIEAAHVDLLGLDRADIANLAFEYRGVVVLMPASAADEVDSAARSAPVSTRNQGADIPMHVDDKEMSAKIKTLSSSS